MKAVWGDKMDLKKYAQKVIQNFIAEHKEEIVNLEKDFIETEKLEDIYNWNGYFEIFIESEDSGFRGDVQNIRYRNKYPEVLKNVIKAACLEFINNNYETLSLEKIIDIQVILPNGTFINLPKKYWKKQVEEIINNIYLHKV